MASSLYSDDPSAVSRIIEQLGLSAVAEDDPDRLSPGELRRVGVARALARVAGGAAVLLLDEPTAHLDPAHAMQVERAIAEIRGTVTIIFASHEEGMRRLADRRVLLGEQGGFRAVVKAASPPVSEPATHDTTHDTTYASSGILAELLAFLRPTAGRMLAAIALGTGASIFAVSLTALSGWLIVRASEQPPIMYLTVAIVGVRFFGLGRAALRYCERLVTHDAVLGSVTGLRQRLWSGLAAAGVGSRSVATGANALDHLVAAADRVRDLVPRVVMPASVAVFTAAAAIIEAIEAEITTALGASNISNLDVAFADGKAVAKALGHPHHRPRLPAAQVKRAARLDFAKSRHFGRQNRRHDHGHIRRHHPLDRRRAGANIGKAVAHGIRHDQNGQPKATQGKRPKQQTCQTSPKKAHCCLVFSWAKCSVITAARHQTMHFATDM